MILATPGRAGMMHNVFKWNFWYQDALWAAITEGMPPINEKLTAGLIKLKS